MKDNEFKKVKIYLNNLLNIEENKYFQDNEEKIFYLTYKVSFIPYQFAYPDCETFYIFFQVEDYGIYFNDIEECFGICKIENNQCNKFAEFYDNLAPTVRKFKKEFEQNNVDWLFE